MLSEHGWPLTGDSVCGTLGGGSVLGCGRLSPDQQAGFVLEIGFPFFLPSFFITISFHSYYYSLIISRLITLTSTSPYFVS